MPLTKAPASAAAYVLAVFTASSIAPSGGIGVSAGTASGWSISMSAVRMIAFSSGAIRSTDQPSACRPICSSSSSLRSSAACASERVNSEASRGSVSLIERPVTSAWYRANAAARRWSERRAMGGSGPRDVVAGLGLDLDAVADVDEQRDADRGPGLERRRLVAAARRGVAPQPRLGLGDLELDRRRQLHTVGLLVDEQHVDLVVGLRPAQRVGHAALRDGELLVAGGVHEVRVGAVRVEELHLAHLGAHGPELLAGAEGLVDHVAVLGAAQLGAHERAALAGLHVLELEDLVDGAVDLDVVAVLELVGADHVATDSLEAGCPPAPAAGRVSA